MISRTINSFLLVVPLPLVLNVDVPPFLVSDAIAFSYTYDCIQQTVCCICIKVSVWYFSLRVPENCLRTCRWVSGIPFVSERSPEKFLQCIQNVPLKTWFAHGETYPLNWTRESAVVYSRKINRLAVHLDWGSLESQRERGVLKVLKVQLHI